jgi:hypothetical protein
MYMGNQTTKVGVYKTRGQTTKVGVYKTRGPAHTTKVGVYKTRGAQNMGSWVIYSQVNSLYEFRQGGSIPILSYLFDFGISHIVVVESLAFSEARVYSKDSVGNMPAHPHYSSLDAILRMKYRDSFDLLGLQ